MRSPPKRIGNSALGRFDVLVIGSGAGGSSVACVLAEQGKKVLILEAGANYFFALDHPDTSQLETVFSNDELKLNHRYFIVPDPLVEPRTFRRSANDKGKVPDDPRDREVNHLPKTVGGGSMHADLKVPRFMPEDFHLGHLRATFPGTEFADWPVDYDMLEPFYEYIETIMGVQGPDEVAPQFLPRRRKPYPMKPGLPMYLGLKASEAARSLGYSPFSFPSAINSQVYDGRAACTDCGFCGRYVCGIHAKGTPAVTTLRRALLTGNCLLHAETRVVKLLYDAARREITGVSALGPDGESLIYTADQYVLAASPIESARLLFLSDLSGPGLGNSSGWVGQNLTFHYQTVMAGIFQERLHGHRGRTVTHGMADLRRMSAGANAPLGGLVEFGVSVDPVEEALIYYSQGRVRGSELMSLMRYSPLRDRLMVLTMHGEDAPQRSNSIVLDRSVRDLDGLPAPCITYNNHAFELEASAQARPKLKELLEKAGARTAVDGSSGKVPSTRHIMGTLRFGTDPTQSVCGPDGRFHDIGNLYTADGSLFPTSSGSNPTLTIMALAARIGAGMAHPGNPERIFNES